MSAFQVAIISGKVFLALNVISISSINVWLFIKNEKRMDKTTFLFMLLLLGTLYIELYSAYLADKNIPNLFLTHYYTIGLFFILSIIYYGLLERFKLVVPISVIIFSSVMIYQLLDSKLIYNEFNTSGFIVAACVMMTYAFFYYIEYITKKMYWDIFNVGLFLYLGGSSVIFLTMNSWKDLGTSYMPIWTINASLFALYQLFISLTIYRLYRVKKKQNGISSV